MAETARRFLRTRRQALLRAEDGFGLEELHDVEDALSRIDDDMYGLCEHCGGPIGRQRLSAFPEARYCVSCEGSAEESLLR